jgi:hypothetical protein
MLCLNMLWYYLIFKVSVHLHRWLLLNRNTKLYESPIFRILYQRVAEIDPVDRRYTKNYEMLMDVLPDSSFAGIVNELVIEERDYLQTSTLLEIVNLDGFLYNMPPEWLRNRQFRPVSVRVRDRGRGRVDVGEELERRMERVDLVGFETPRVVVVDITRERNKGRRVGVPRELNLRGLNYSLVGMVLSDGKILDNANGWRWWRWLKMYYERVVVLLVYEILNI